jgi:predicted dehydrogenase
MSNSGKVKVGIIGSQFEADIHAASFKIASEHAELVAVASPTPGNAAALAKRYGIPRVFTDYREMIKERDLEMITIAAPNALHAQMTADCARAGKHVVCEKPLAMTIEEAEQMIHDTRKAGVLLLYAEELFFTPKYLKAKEMADDGAFGKIHVVKQSEKHFGPHAAWFWDVNRCGGGALMDLGCHGIAFCYWFLGRPRDSVCLLSDGHLCSLLTRPRAKMKLTTFWNSRVVHSALLRTSGGQRGEMDDNRSLRCGRLSMLEQWADELVFQFAAAFIRCAYENGDPL